MRSPSVANSVLEPLRQARPVNDCGAPAHGSNVIAEVTAQGVPRSARAITLDAAPSRVRE